METILGIFFISLTILMGIIIMYGEFTGPRRTDTSKKKNENWKTQL